MPNYAIGNILQYHVVLAPHGEPQLVRYVRITAVEHSDLLTRTPTFVYTVTCCEESGLARVIPGACIRYTERELNLYFRR